MTKRSYTKDERFLIALYEQAKLAGDHKTPFSRFTIGESIGLQERAIKTISRDLLQCNFIKKNGEEEVFLTANGLSLVEKLLF